jgi:hypothetical protein
MAANNPADAAVLKADEPKAPVLDPNAQQRLDEQKAAEQQAAARKPNDRVVAARKAAQHPMLSAVAGAKALAETAFNHRDLTALCQAFQMLADGLHREHGGTPTRTYDVRYRNADDRVITTSVVVADPSGAALSPEDEAAYTDDYVAAEMRDRYGATEETRFERRPHEDAPWA